MGSPQSCPTLLPISLYIYIYKLSKHLTFIPLWGILNTIIPSNSMKQTIVGGDNIPFHS